MALARLRLREADMRKLGSSECHPRHRLVACFGRQSKQRVLDYDAGVIIRHVGKCPAGDIADRVNFSVSRLQPLVDHDPAWTVFDAGLVEIKPIHVRAPASGYQKI